MPLPLSAHPVEEGAGSETPRRSGFSDPHPSRIPAFRKHKLNLDDPLAFLAFGPIPNGYAGLNWSECSVLERLFRPSGHFAGARQPSQYCRYQRRYSRVFGGHFHTEHDNGSEKIDGGNLQSEAEKSQTDRFQIQEGLGRLKREKKCRGSCWSRTTLNRADRFSRSAQEWF